MKKTTALIHPPVKITIKLAFVVSRRRRWVKNSDSMLIMRTDANSLHSQSYERVLFSHETFSTLEVYYLVEYKGWDASSATTMLGVLVTAAVASHTSHLVCSNTTHYGYADYSPILRYSLCPAAYPYAITNANECHQTEIEEGEDLLPLTETCYPTAVNGMCSTTNSSRTWSCTDLTEPQVCTDGLHTTESH